MSVDAKICGINSAPALDAAVKGGARFVGFNFYARSPRSLDAEAAAALADRVPQGISRVGLIVDESNETIDGILRQVPLDMLQVHGQETPARVGEIRRRFGKPVMKAIKVAIAADVESAAAFDGAADWLLFDAKAPPQMTNALPGGNAISFDWSLLADRRWNRPWMLSGGTQCRKSCGGRAHDGRNCRRYLLGSRRSARRQKPGKNRGVFGTCAPSLS